MANFYERFEQLICITPESSYGTPHEDASTYGGSAWTALEAAYEDLKRINIIPTGTTVPLPSIDKIKKYDIDNAKHAKKIASGNIEPIRFSMELELIYPVFLAYAIGTATTSGADPYTHTVVEAKKSNIGDSTDGNQLCSFTMHCQQEHPSDDAQDIVYDLFGCIVEEYSLTINKGNGTITESVTIACPYTAYDSANVNTGSTLSEVSGDIYTWNDLLGNISSTDEAAKTTTAYLLQEDGTTDITPDSVETLSLSIANNVTFKPDVNKRYMAYATSGRRDVSLDISGYITSKEKLTYWQEKWDATNNRPDSASGAIQSYIYLERGTNDYIYIPICNLLPVEHSCEFTSIDEGIKGADLSYTDGIPQTAASGRIFYDTDDEVQNVVIKDSRDKLWYHNTT